MHGKNIGDVIFREKVGYRNKTGHDEHECGTTNTAVS